MSTEAPETTVVSTAGEHLSPQQAIANVASAKNGAPKAPSAASKKAAKTAGDKPATPKAAPKAAESTEPAPNERKQIVGNAAIDAVADMIASWKPADHNGVTVLEASELGGSYISFTPGGYWRPELAEPDTGRGHKHQLDPAGKKARAAFVKRHTPVRRSAKRAA